MRQINEQLASSEASLFRPQVSYRVRWSLNTDTPLPPEEPGGKNPPDGAIIDYYLKTDAPEIGLEILDASGNLVRRFSSSDIPPKVNENELPYPTYWFRPPQILSAKAGMQRFVWDLHYPVPEGVRRSYGMAAIFHDTPLSPLGPWVQPGEYTVRLTLSGKSSMQPLMVKMDPRVTIPPEVLKQQFELSMSCYRGLQQVYVARQEINRVRSQIQSVWKGGPAGDVKELLNKIGRKASAIDGTGWAEDVDVMYDEAYATSRKEETLAGLQTKLNYLMALLQGVDAKPTAQAVAAVHDEDRPLKEVLGRWEEMKKGKNDLLLLNEELRKANRSPLKVAE